MIEPAFGFLFDLLDPKKGFFCFYLFLFDFLSLSLAWHLPFLSSPSFPPLALKRSVGMFVTIQAAHKLSCPPSLDFLVIDEINQHPGIRLNNERVKKAKIKESLNRTYLSCFVHFFFLKLWNEEDLVQSLAPRDGKRLIGRSTRDAFSHYFTCHTHKKWL